MFVAEAVLLLHPNPILRHSCSNISPLVLILYLPAITTLNFSASASASFTSPPTFEDSYGYQTGFGNLLASEAIPGALPEGGRNVPQRCPYDLYSEHLSGTSFISSRATVQNVWMYRIRPSVAHHPLEPLEYNSHLEACFSLKIRMSNPHL